MSASTPQPNPHNPSLPYFPTTPMTLDDFDRVEQRYVNTVELPVTPARLFEIFEDPASWPKWALGIGRVEWTSPEPYGAGTTRTVFFWGGMEVYEDFFLWEAPHRMAFTFTGITQEIWTQFGEHYVVEPRGEDGCHFTWTVGYTPTGPFAKMHGLIRPMMAMGFRLYMVLLKRYCRKVG